MHKEILRSIVGIEIFPIISLCLFVAVFTIVLIWTVRLDRGWLSRQAGLPLDPDAHEATAGRDSTGGVL
jgi:cytochrome c oxidase cbb3-type subunit 4